MRFEEIVDAIIYNQLRIFDINPILTEEFDWFIELLKQNTSLQAIKLTHNQLDDASVLKLVEALKDKQQITELDLSYNNISSIGAQYIANLLKTNSSLTVINLYSNKIGNSGMNSLLEALKTNKTLKSINLDENEITLARDKFPTLSRTIAKHTLLEKQIKQQEDLMRSKAENILVKNQAPLQKFLTKNSIFNTCNKPELRLYQPTSITQVRSYLT